MMGQSVSLLQNVRFAIATPQVFPAVRWWLWGLCGMVWVMVMLGGATRLTDSGLSMVEWQPLHVFPPLSLAEWQAVFQKYQLSPQYILRNHGMTLAEFEGIFWLEYIHRLWGRLIGLAVLLPLLIFSWKGMLSASLRWRMVLLFCLGGLQGALGWYMVASGLVDHPEVSHYRLAGHLGLAVVMFALLLWTALTYGRGRGAMGGGLPVRPWVLWGLVGLVFITIEAGALVAGLDAGLIYNTFPLMNGQMIPSDWGDLSPWWLNMLENRTAVQFNHRLLASLTAIACCGLWVWIVFGAMRSSGGQRVRLAAYGLLCAVLGQATLGILTLLYSVPLSLAVAHQGGSLLVLGCLLWIAAEAFYPATQS